MSEEILINVTPQETRVAIVEQGIVQELHIERSSSLGLVGNIYRGSVCRVLPGMQSAFVEIGLQRAAFLHVADVLECTSANQEKTIQEVLHEGQPLMVQVVKEPIGTKRCAAHHADQYRRSIPRLPSSARPYWRFSTY